MSTRSVRGYTNPVTPDRRTPTWNYVQQALVKYHGLTWKEARGYTEEWRISHDPGDALAWVSRGAIIPSAKPAGQASRAPNGLEPGWYTHVIAELEGGEPTISRSKTVVDVKGPTRVSSGAAVTRKAYLGSAEAELTLWRRRDAPDVGQRVELRKADGSRDEFYKSAGLAPPGVPSLADVLNAKVRAAAASTVSKSATPVEKADALRAAMAAAPAGVMHLSGFPEARLPLVEGATQIAERYPQWNDSLVEVLKWLRS